MKITREQKEKITSLFPKPRGNVKIGGGDLALVYICENGCAWRSLPASFGPWHTIYMRLSRRAKNGVPERIYGRLLLDTIGRIREPCGDPVFLLMDRACEDWETRWLAFQRGYTPVVPQKRTGSIRGSIAKSCINGGMKLNGCSAG
jgi:transposase